MASGAGAKSKSDEPAISGSGQWLSKTLLWKPTDWKFGTKLARGWIRGQSGLKRRSIQLCLVSE
jgi:hypothetical protein